MTVRIVQVDAFTATPFAGNPAAVCVLASPASEQWMRHVAREMNLSETAFLVRNGDAWHLRWFTPTVEIALCGHATLASAHVLWEDGHLPAGTQARFDTMSGRLTADRDGQWIAMDFPAVPVTPVEAPADLLPALSVSALAVGKNRMDYLVEVGSEAEVLATAPDHTRLRRLPVRGVIVTARAADSQYDFISRFFAPGSGVDEDPVTGSAHCALAPYWAAKLGRTELVGRQASARSGIVKVRTQGERVILAGQAVVVLRGELNVDPD
ncbi:MAG TPA: PhzF family phenazine biosynthesis protein [Gemmatimonadales bacterium]|nr:PhzF family phenazine biosynthesis protein [Gemmatimonadales bacterium]